ncbi:EF hand domain-containing protein [Roseibium sp. TrichSKD4]|uniref:EF-hand domain-containing protein n=1 Tax=Roseibium sp. TrichSKD4 TaxID=744980 RepID=UPI0001E571E3|nr:EF-hand domain-containing protein [Roseibium sp. TrichSKD4]EFO29646.1 EF hand domain-containing protein [Roseibium sp. TrichSKD4]
MIKTLSKHTALLSLVLMMGAGVSLAAGKPGAHFIENWDLNQDGQVTAEEARERRSDVFASFDSNDDGYLDAEEYVFFDEARANDQKNHEGGKGQGHGKGKRNPANGMKLEVNDTDKDGKVSQDEFLDNAASWIEMIDRDGDGVVTTADFGRGKK